MVGTMQFIPMIKKHMAAVGLPDTFCQRAVNDGFSGGEKKRNEMVRCACCSRS